MPSSFANETITRRRYPTVRDHGADVVDRSASPDELPIEGCWLEPFEGVEDNNGRQTNAYGWRVAAPYEADVLSSDFIVYQGVEYEVSTAVQRVPSPTRRLRQSLFSIRRWVNRG